MVHHGESYLTVRADFKSSPTCCWLCSLGEAFSPPNHEPSFLSNSHINSPHRDAGDAKNCEQHCPWYLVSPQNTCPPSRPSAHSIPSYSLRSWVVDTTLKSFQHLDQRWSMGVLSRINKMHTDSIIKLIIGYGWKKGRTDG